MSPSLKAWRRSDLVFAVALLSLPVLLFWRLVFAGEVLYWGTPLLQFFPWRQLAVDSYAAGQVPLWNPYLGNGAPLAANWQSAVFYLPNALFLLFSVERAMGYSVVVHVGLAGLFMYILGRTLGLSAFASFIGGITYAFSGFIVSRAGFLSMTSTAAWLPLVLAASEAILRRKAIGDGGIRSRIIVAFGSLAVGFLLLAGHGQYSFYSLWMVALYALFRGWQLSGASFNLRVQRRVGAVGAGLKPAPTNTNQPIANSLPEALADSYSSADIGSRLKVWIAICLPVLAMLALGVGVADIQLLPSAELASQSVRAGGAERDFALAYSLWPWQLASLLAPDFFGNPATGDYWGPGNYWETSGYIGIFPLLLIGVAMLRGYHPTRAGGTPLEECAALAIGDSTRHISDPRSQAKPLPIPRLFFLGVAAISVLLAMGRYLPLYPFVFEHVPGFGLFQAPSRFLFLYTLAAATLAGFGADALLKRAGSKGIGRLGSFTLIAGAGIFIAVAAFVLVLGPTEGVRPTFLGALAKLGVLLALSGVIIILGRRLPRRWWQLTIAVFAVVDLLLFALPLNPSTGAQIYDSRVTEDVDLHREGDEIFRIYTPNASFLEKFFATHSFRTYGSSDPSEIRAIRQMLIPNTEAAFGLYESYNYDPLQIGAMKEFLELVDSSGLNPKLLDLMNVRYVLTDTVPSSSSLTFLSLGVNSAYENWRFLGRAYFVADEVVKVSSLQEALREIQKPEFDPRRTAILEEPKPNGALNVILDWLDRDYPIEPSGIGPGRGKAGVTLSEFTPNRVVLAVTADRDGYAVLSDTHYPGWKAWVNGEPATVYRANGVFRAVRVPAGQSAVEFRYEPVSFKAGASVSLLTLITILAVAAWRARRRIVD